MSERLGAAIAMGEVTEHAFYALPRHANGLGLVHGGMLTAFLDGLMGAAVYRAARQTAVTLPKMSASWVAARCRPNSGSSNNRLHYSNIAATCWQAI